MYDFLVFLLASLGGVALIALVAFGIAYWLLTRSVTNRLQSTVDELQGLLLLKEAHQGDQGVSCVPPMSIHLEPATVPSVLWGDSGLRTEKWLVEQGFVPAGQFVIEELSREHLKCFLHAELPIFASLRLPHEADEPYLEFCVHMGSGELVGIANPPENTVQLPSDSPGQFHQGLLSTESELKERMWADALHLLDQCDPNSVSIEEIPELYEQAHALEMEFRMRQGGISTEEIQQAFRQQGQSASKEDIDSIQEQWQTAIEKHLVDFSSRALNQLHAGHRVMIVHDGSKSNHLFRQLDQVLSNAREVVDSEKLRADADSELQALLSQFSPRDAIARFRPLLPDALRYDLIDQLKSPLEADIYLLPHRAYPRFKGSVG